MAIPLRKTKLFLPAARAEQVIRPRLFERLDELLGGDGRVAVLCAPAGSGKTTLLVQWLLANHLPAAWISLDASDNPPGRFFAYLIAVLQQIAPGAGAAALPLLDLPGVNPEEVITILVNDLVSAPQPFLLALDDFHAITNPLLHQAVDLLIEALPPKMRLVLLSREDPPLHLARLRARAQLVELRQADLAFTLAEAAQFVNQPMQLPLSIEQVRVLETRTEGWIAGLQMAALALKAPPGMSVLDERPYLAEVERFLQSFSGTSQYIPEYLIEEVLARQPEDLQAFLLDTSILDRLNADLCAAVTGQTMAEAQRLLAQIVRANLFIIPLDAQAAGKTGAGWFRYHHLFGELLLARLRATAPDRSVDCERRASDWFAANGEAYQAVEFALRARAYQRAADLIEANLLERWQTVDMEFFKLAQRLPVEVVAGRAGLCLQNAWLCVMFGQTDRILPYVEAAERNLAQRSDPQALAQAAFARTLRAHLDDLHNQPVQLDGSLELAYAAIPESNPGMRNSVGVVIGMINFMEADFEVALRYYEAALALDMRVGGTNAVPVATVRIALVLQAQGRLREAQRRLQAAEMYLRERGMRRFYISGAVCLRSADLLLEWNLLDEAEQQLQEGTRLLEDWPIPSMNCMRLILSARLQLARGSLAEASASLAQVDAIRQQTALHPTTLVALERARVQLLLAQGSPAALEEWLAQNDGLDDPSFSFRYEACRIELARVWLALGREAQAIALLKQLLIHAEQRKGSQIVILALLAAAHHQQPAAGLSILDEALRLAQPEGYLRTFFEIGAPLADMLRFWLQHGSALGDSRQKRYVQSILALFASQPGGKPLASPTPLQKPISPRELEVLRLVAGGLSNQQIADRLVISLRTVKKHVENIHGKLDVQNRTQAVVRAQELGLLP